MQFCSKGLVEVGRPIFGNTALIKLRRTKKFKIIYISLSGISKIDALEHLFFMKLLPFIRNQESSIAKNATTFVTNI